MKITIPDALKADLPQTMWGKILTATPVVMTVVATLLAGLASSEMTRAQYSRSLAAQQQSKAGDQWGYFQAKRLRGAIQRSTLDLLQNTTDVHPLDTAALDQTDPELKSPAGQQALAALRKGELSVGPTTLAIDPNLKAILNAVETSAPETEIAGLLAKVDGKMLAAAVGAARDNAASFDVSTRPIDQAIDHLEKVLAQQTGVTVSLRRDFTAARLRYTAARYDAEARLNQAIGNSYEVQVRKSNIEAERHHTRSQRFFFGMLAAQAGVIIATFAMAARKRNLLWSLAAAAGAAAVGFAIYVYLYV